MIRPWFKAAVTRREVAGQAEGQSAAESSGCPDDELRLGARRWWDRAMWFWVAIVAGALILAAVSIFAKHGVAGTRNGVLIVALMVCYFGWFVVTPPILRGRLRLRGFPVAARAEYALLATGLILTIVLIALDSRFLAVTYVFMGIIFMAAPVRLAVAALLVQVPFFLVAMGFPRRPSSGAWGAILSLVSVAGICYTMTRLMRDRAERDRLIADITAAQEQLRLTAARDVELAALRERNRLAREMHDSIGHALVLVSMKMEAAQRLLEVDPTRGRLEWETTKQLVRSTMADLRNSLAGLRPAALEDGSLRTAVSDLAADVSHHSGVDTVTEVEGNVEGLPQAAQEAIYRVAQEGLSNVAKHSGARHAWVKIGRQESIVWVRVEDDGIGLDAATKPSGSHMGISGMRERVEALGGTLRVGPRAGGGTTLQATAPIGA